jgi:serine/threonine-protein kinase
MVTSVLISKPELPSDTAPELEALVRACLQPEPAQRPESALQVRRALEDYLEHQGSLQLAAQARARVPALLALLASPAPDSAQLDSLFAECRFGFQQALRTWPGNLAAREGLTQAVEAMVRHALARGAPQAAVSLLHELQAPNAALEAQVRSALAQEQERAQQLERLRELERTLDPRTDGRVRLGAGLAMSVVWTVAPILGKHLVAWDSRVEMMGIVPVALLAGLGLVLVARTVKRHTPLNLAIERILLFGMFGEAFMLSAYRVLVGDLGARTVPLVAFFWWTIATIVAWVFERKLTPTAVAYLGALLSMLVWPQWRFEAICLANVTFCCNMLLMLRQLRSAT